MLGDWDISRDAPYFGIPIPDAPGKYFYVWLDAPIGYLASLKNYFDSGKARARGEPRSFEAFLSAPDTEQIHFIGKDIIYFHTLFWPAMLKFAGAPFRVPEHVYVHGFINLSGEKMSKSRGTGLSPLRYLELGMNPEWLRYYIAAKLNGSVEDIDFNPEDFTLRVNSDLVGKYVNIASRAAAFLTRQFGGQTGFSGDTHAMQAESAALALSVQAGYEAREYGRAIREVMAYADRINQAFDARQPWVLAKDPAKAAELQDVCSRAVYGFKVLSVLLAPVLPQLSARAAAELFALERTVPVVRCGRAAHRASVCTSTSCSAWTRSSWMHCSAASPNLPRRLPPSRPPRQLARPLRPPARSPSMTSSASTCAWRASPQLSWWKVPTSS